VIQRSPAARSGISSCPATWRCIPSIIFPADGARAYLRDLPDAELHLPDTGHFALEDRGEQIAALMRDFLARKLPRASR
jgi:pimeloyl-ACP methyl ester carboxylesterase